MRITLEQAKMIVSGNQPQTGHWVSFDPDRMRAKDLIPLVENGLRHNDLEMMAEQFIAAVRGLENDLAILALIAGFVTVHIPDGAYEDDPDDGWDGEIAEDYVMIGEDVLTHPDHIAFVTACRRAGMKPYMYHGRYYYVGPGVNVENLADAARLGVNIPMLSDNMGKGYVIYTRVSEKADPTIDNASAEAMQKMQEMLSALNPMAFGPQS